MTNVFALGLAEGLKPKPRLTLTQWAESNLYLSPERSASPGPFRVGDASYQRGMLDACTDPNVETVVFMTSSQVGKSSVLAAVQAFYAECEPAPQLCAQPTQILADAYAVETFDPLVRDSAPLRTLFSLNKGKATTAFKSYPGGYITFVGANNPSSLAMRPIRIVTGDEVDRWPVSAGKEGSPLELVRKRTTTFRNRKLIFASTPVLKEVSAITKMFERTDQRYFHVVCPDCNEAQSLKWEQVHYRKGHEQEAMYACEHCGSMWTELQKRRLVRDAEKMGGGWRTNGPSTGWAGFHISELYSPWSSMAQMARAWSAAEGNPELEQTFFNTSLGLPFEGDISSFADANNLLDRREDFPANRIPGNCGLVTAGVDVQGDRLEVLYVGWGVGNECWLLDRLMIYSDPSAPRTWLELEEALMRRFPHPSGKVFPVEAACIDSGGHHTQKVYEFANKNEKFARRWHAIKGVPGEKKPIFMRSKQRLKNQTKLFLVGVDDAKSAIYQMYSIQTVGPGYVHVPTRFEEDECRQLTAERAELTYINGFPKRTWTKPRMQRNEMLDMLVYALAARHAINIDVETRLRMLAAQAQPQQRTAQAAQALDPYAIGKMFAG